MDDEHGSRRRSRRRRQPSDSAGSVSDSSRRRRRGGHRRSSEQDAQATEAELQAIDESSPRVLGAELLATPREDDDEAPPASTFDMTAAMALVQTRSITPARTVTPSATSRVEDGGDILARAADRARQKKQQKAAEAAALAAGVEQYGAPQRSASTQPGYDSLEYVMDESGAFRQATDVAKGAAGGWASKLRRDGRLGAEGGAAAARPDTGPQPPANPVRRLCFHACQSRAFSVTVLLTILYNAAILASEPTLKRRGQQELLETSELLCNLVFTVEMLLKMLGLGLCSGKHSYFASGWNLVDAVIVVSGWVTFGFDQAGPDNEFGVANLLRLVRVLRPLRSMRVVPMLRKIINALIAAVRGGPRQQHAAAPPLPLALAPPIPVSRAGQQHADHPLLLARDRYRAPSLPPSCVSTPQSQPEPTPTPEPPPTSTPEPAPTPSQASFASRSSLACSATGATTRQPMSSSSPQAANPTPYPDLSPLDPPRPTVRHCLLGAPVRFRDRGPPQCHL